MRSMRENRVPSRYESAALRGAYHYDALRNMLQRDN